MWTPRLVMTGLLLILLLPAPAIAQWYRFSGTAMTTPIDLEFWSEAEAGQAEDLWLRVLAEFTGVDEGMSRYREDSELSRVNRTAAEGAVKITAPLFRVLAAAESISEASDGAFDISFASVGHLYDYRNNQQPSDEEVQALLPRISYRDIWLDPEASSVAFARPGLMLDLGGIAKGYAVDRGIAVLQAAEIGHARLSAGGDMRLLGDRRGRPWMVGVRDPRQEGRLVVALPLESAAISTSGDYERYFIDDNGARIHHILSPQTGRPAGGVQSVTVIGADAMTTDALSTAVFVLGAEQGLALINRLEGIDAVIIDEHRKLFYSEDLMAGVE